MARGSTYARVASHDRRRWRTSLAAATIALAMLMSGLAAGPAVAASAAAISSAAPAASAGRPATIATAAAIANSLSPDSHVDLSLSLGDGGSPFPSGGSGVYTVVVVNSGTTASAGAVSVTFSTSGTPIAGIPSAGGSGWACSINSRVCNTSATVPAGGSLPPISVTVNLAQANCCGAEAALSATVTNPTDGSANNNAASISTPISRATGANLTLSVADSGQPFVAG
ncbi:MAG: hypothetical protein QOK39_399, partial [Acidimicrobiaceae bacterium]|nr:hypothetical protein [Acidimicrobiaceae bacterium]